MTKLHFQIIEFNKSQAHGLTDRRVKNESLELTITPGWLSF